METCNRLVPGKWTNQSDGGKLMRLNGDDRVERLRGFGLLIQVRDSLFVLVLNHLRELQQVLVDKSRGVYFWHRPHQLTFVVHRDSI